MRRFAGEMRCKTKSSAWSERPGESGEGTDEWIYLSTNLTVKAKLQLAQYEWIKNQNIRILTSVSPKDSRMHAVAVDVCSLYNTCHTIRFFFNSLRGRKKCIKFCCYHLFRPQHKINKKVLQLSRTLLRNEGCIARAAVGTGLRSASVVQCSCMALPTYVLQFELSESEASRKVLAKQKR